MYKLLKGYIEEYNYESLYSSVIGLSRSLLAIGTLLVLLFNKPEFLFKEVAGSDQIISCGSGNAISLYCLVPQDFFYFNVVRWISIIILVLVIVGWRPRYTGILHWWVTFSLGSSATVLEGGEQVAQVLTLLLIPLTLADSRKNHWISGNKNSNQYINIVALVSYIFIRVQMSAIYFNATVAKFNDSWLNGTALYYFFEDSMFGFNKLWSLILNPILDSVLVVPLTWSVLVLEFILFLGILARGKIRIGILIIGFVLHGSIAIIIGLYPFSIIMMSGLILYLYPLHEEINLKKIKWGYKNE